MFVCMVYGFLGVNLVIKMGGVMESSEKCEIELYYFGIKLDNVVCRSKGYVSEMFFILWSFYSGNSILILLSLISYF